MQKFYTDQNGVYLGSYDDNGTGAPCPFENAIEISSPPELTGDTE